MESICDLHTHTILCGHAYSSLSENIQIAIKKGLKYFGYSEHEPHPYLVGTSPGIFNAATHIPDKFESLTIFKGCEFNILDKGMIETNGIIVDRLDYGIASMHPFAYSKEHTSKENTEAYLNVLDYDFIKIIGHIDDGKFPCDYEKIVKKCKDVHKLIEINDSSYSKVSPRMNAKENIKEVIKYCIKYDLPVIINSDAHICYDVGNTDNAISILNEMNYPHDRILNYNEELFKDYFNK